MPWTPAVFAAALALGAAAAWGAGDFTGGLAARRVGPIHTVLISYGVGLTALATVALARLEPFPPPADLIWGATAGIVGMTGLVLLFRGFALGRMGIVAPVSGVLTAAIPAVVGALTEGLPHKGQLAGFAAALISIWLLSRPEPLGGRPAGLGMALLAGVGFAGFFIALDQIAPGAVFWPLVVGRLAACGLMVGVMLSTRRPVIPSAPPLGLLAAAGVLDVSGNLFFLLAVQRGRLDVSAVLASLYPAVTAMLARVIAREHMTRPQVVGVAGAVLAIALMTM